MPQDRPTSDALLQIADDCFSQGYVALAEHLATLAGAEGAPADQVEALRRRSAEARAVDAAAERQGMRHDEFVIPSIERQPDGTPFFLLPIPTGAAGQAEVMQVVAQEVQGDGVDAELRVFLGTMIEPGDAFIDCDPGFGFSALSAASRYPGEVTLVTRAADDDHTAFIRRALEFNNFRSAVVEPPINGNVQSLGALFRHASVQRAQRVIVYAGQADDLDALLPDLDMLVKDPRVAAIAWSIGADAITNAMADRIEAMGASHFVIASDSEGAVLVPQSELEGATLIISVPMHVLRSQQAA